MGRIRAYEQILHTSVLIYEDRVSKRETSPLVLEAQDQVAICDPLPWQHLGFPGHLMERYLQCSRGLFLAVTTYIVILQLGLYSSLPPPHFKSTTSGY